MPDNNKCDDGNWCTGTNVAFKNSDTCVAQRYDVNGDGVISASETNLVGGDDGNGCTFTDISFQCNDGKPCTTDSCNSGDGCHNDYKCSSVFNGTDSCNNTGNSNTWGLASSVNTGTTVSAGTCHISACSSGWFDFDGVYSNGCECQQDTYDLVNGSAGDSCAAARDVGTLTDNNADVVYYAGNILGATDGNDSDWYVFYASDTGDSSCDNQHVRIQLSSNPGDRFRFNVYKGGCGSQVCSNSQDYEDYQDFQVITGSPSCDSGTEADEVQPSGGSVSGQCPCTTGKSCTSNKCLDDSNTYYVEVYRASGAIDCTQYVLEMSNGYY